MGDLKQALHANDLAAVSAAIKAEPKAARHPQFILAAAGRAFLPAVQLLHENGADINGVWRNYSPLHALIQTDPHAAAGKPEPHRLACLDWMLDHGADPEQLGAWPAARAIIIAAFVGEPEYVARLKQAGARIDGFTGAALGDCKLVEKTLRDRPGFAHERDGGLLTALQCAAGSRLPKVKTVEAARLLLDAGADPNAKTRTWGHNVDAAYFAAGTNSKAMFELLLDHGADLAEALPHAVWGKHYELAELALARGAQPDRAIANGKPLLNDLIRWGQIPQTKWLLAHGASPNTPDADGWTAAHQAASRGNAQLMRAVIEAGADLARRDKQHNTPLDIARLMKRDKMAAMLAT
jgi:ankyrin repeat protein